MKKKFFIEKFNKVHFIGVGGISTSALARYCLAHKISVTGSDKVFNEQMRLLKSLGAEVYVKHKKSLDEQLDAVVYTSAISEDNPELCVAKERGIPIFKRSEFLGQLAKDFNFTLSVCGTHGKTTTTAMISEVLICAGVNPTVFLGGEGGLFGNFYNGAKEVVVLEACEYKKNFLDIKSSAVIVTNVDNDHLDSYSGVSEEIDCVNKFIDGTVAFINADDENSATLHTFSMITYGVKNPACYTAKNIKYVEHGTAFSVYAYGRRLGRIKIPLKGEYNVYNALSAFAFCNEFKVPFLVIKRSLEKFSGVKRRDEFIGEYNNISCFADYAHHPQEIFSFLSTKRDMEKTLIVFQPHTYSRTKNLMQEFVEVFKGVPKLIIYKTYPARERYDEKGSAKTLCKKIKEVNSSVKYVCGIQTLKAEMDNLRGVEKICFVGAGDLYEMVKKILKKSVK